LLGSRIPLTGMIAQSHNLNTWPQPRVHWAHRRGGGDRRRLRPEARVKKGALNKITRTTKDAAVEAAHELGQVPVKLWAKQLDGDTNGLNTALVLGTDRRSSSKGIKY
jgi:hypothetical protein